ncbi:uncharacterized protein PG998_014589 [Apiospora kogelbergensis]|uniref:uncharacterized protein n=1 Tax=Apiospora kogelbergensis TaxID=1337665 RepID=UPI00313086FD
MHSVITPAIHYWGTEVVLITTENEDGTTNIAPMSSAWWLGDRCYVLNIPSDDMGSYMNAIAKTTGSPVLPPIKQTLSYEHCKDKFGRAGLTPQPSDLVRPPRIAECPVQMEAELVASNELMQDAPGREGAVLAIEVKVLRTHIEDDLRLPGHSNRINADLWRPMIMSFQHLYGLAPKRIDSKLASINEEKYRPLTGTDLAPLTGTALTETDPAELGGEIDQSCK